MPEPKNKVQLGEIVTTAKGLRELAGWIEEKTGTDGQVKMNVTMIEYEDYNVLGYDVIEEEPEKKEEQKEEPEKENEKEEEEKEDE